MSDIENRLKELNETVLHYHNTVISVLELIKPKMTSKEVTGLYGISRAALSKRVKKNPEMIETGSSSHKKYKTKEVVKQI